MKSFGTLDTEEADMRCIRLDSVTNAVHDRDWSGEGRVKGKCK